LTPKWLQNVTKDTQNATAANTVLEQTR
jgi:hypothetical protein